MLLCGSGKLFAQFPYFESFKNSTAVGVVFGEDAVLTSGTVDPAGEGYLRLTNNSQNRKGYIYSNASFSSKFGLKIDFEFFTHGGGQFGVSADGITFFLFDSSVSSFNIGGFGGSLGYAQYQFGGTGPVSPGVSGGYLGIGIDEYGNFSNPVEARQGGVIGPKGGLSPNSITLRGKGNGNSTDPGNYRYLTSIATTDLAAADRFSISTESRHPNPTDAGYRRAIIELKPAVSPVTGYYITVKIITGGNPTKTHLLINNYHYPDAAPAQVRYGIASSTGFEHNFHEIRNLKINAFDPIPPVANDDLNNTATKNTAVDLLILKNDRDENGDQTLDPASIVITGQTPGAVITKNVVTGVVTYTPPLNFLGKDTFFYTVKDEDGLVSNIAKVEVDVKATKPVGVPDQEETLLNTPVDIDVLVNDPSKNGVVVIAAPATSQGGVAFVNSDGTIKFTPKAGFLGNDTFTYRLRNSDNLESDPITVTVIVRAPPVANHDHRTTPMDTQVDIDLSENDTDADGTINKASVTVKTPPVNGTVSQVDALGNITYTPKFNFVGIDSFTYTIKDNDGLESLPATVTIVITSIPKIGLSKALTVVKDALHGAFLIHFTFRVGNYGSEPLEKISIKDNLNTVFAGAEVKIVTVGPSGSLKANKGFNGTTDIELLDPSSTLAPNSSETVELLLNVQLNASEETYQNNAVAEGYSTLNGQKAVDASVAGLLPDPYVKGDVSPSGPTFFKLKRGPLFIPEGFSPNNDGINDVFIVSNSQGKTVSLEVYNRWGNRVYKSTTYKNDWDGRCTEGIYLGQDLPVGTYYYLVVIDNQDKYMGYITINR